MANVIDQAGFVSVSAFWRQAVTRLDTALMAQILGGAGRVRLAAEDLSRGEGLQGSEWGRVVIVPTTTLWPEVSSPGEPRNVSFLIRSEVGDFRARGYDPLIALEAAQAEAFRRLRNWTPTPVEGAWVIIPVYRWSAPQTSPQYDSARGVWYLSAEYRTELIGWESTTITGTVFSTGYAGSSVITDETVTAGDFIPLGLPHRSLVISSGFAWFAADGGGAQLHPSVIGPDAQLGSTGGADSNDPLYVDSPDPVRYDFSDTHYLTWFNAALFDAIITQSKWTMIWAGRTPTAGSVKGVASKAGDAGTKYGIQLIANWQSSPAIGLVVHYAGAGSRHDYAYTAHNGQTRGVMITGYDASLARANRITINIEGTNRAVTTAPAGVDGTVAATDSPFRMGMAGDGLGAGSGGQGGALVLIPGVVMTEGEAAQWNTWLASLGWAP